MLAGMNITETKESTMKDITVRVIKYCIRMNRPLKVGLLACHRLKRVIGRPRRRASAPLSRHSIILSLPVSSCICESLPKSFVAFVVVVDVEVPS